MQSLDNFSLGLVRTPLILNRLTTTIGLPLLSCAILHARKKAGVLSCFMLQLPWIDLASISVGPGRI